MLSNCFPCIINENAFNFFRVKSSLNTADSTLPKPRLNVFFIIHRQETAIIRVPNRKQIRAHCRCAFFVGSCCLMELDTVKHVSSQRNFLARFRRVIRPVPGILCSSLK